MESSKIIRGVKSWLLPLLVLLLFNIRFQGYWQQNSQENDNVVKEVMFLFWLFTILAHQDQYPKHKVVAKGISYLKSIKEDPFINSHDC